MKKIILLLLCLFLSILTLAGCSRDSEPFTEKDYTADGEKITEVYIDVRDRAIKVSLSADDQIHMKYFENATEYYNISVSDNVLTMRAENDKDWTDYLGGKSISDSRTIILQVPEKLLTVLDLSTTNEDISLSPITVTNEVSLSSNGGNIIFDKLSVGKAITLNVKNGDITCSVAGSYDDYAILGTIKKGKSNLPGDKADGEKTLHVSANNGDIDIQFISE